MRFVRWLLSFVPRKPSAEYIKKMEDHRLVHEWASALADGNHDEANRISARSWGIDEFPKAVTTGIGAPVPEPLFAKEK